jgi:hypothetical protein
MGEVVAHAVVGGTDRKFKGAFAAGGAVGRGTGLRGRAGGRGDGGRRGRESAASEPRELELS